MHYRKKLTPLIGVGAGPASPVLAGTILIIDWPGKPQVIDNLHAKRSMQKLSRTMQQAEEPIIG